MLDEPIRGPGTPSSRDRAAAEELLNVAHEGVMGRVPVWETQDGATPSLRDVTAPDGSIHQFNASHEKRLYIRPEFNIPRGRLAHAQALHDCLQAEAFAQAIHELLLHLSQSPGAPLTCSTAETMALVRMTAELGSSEHTIGMAWVTADGEIESTKLARHRNWTGNNRHLENVAGLHLLVQADAQNSNQPGYAMGFRQPAAEDDVQNATDDFPAGNAIHLREILIHHGAASCRWKH